MRLPMFNTKEERTEYLLNMAKAIEDNGLRIARQNLYDARKGVGKEGFFKMNYVRPEHEEKVWEDHLIWLEEDYNYLLKKVRRLRRQAIS